MPVVELNLLTASTNDSDWFGILILIMPYEFQTKISFLWLAITNLRVKKNNTEKTKSDTNQAQVFKQE